MNRRLNKRHQRTLAVIFSPQVPATLQWRRIEALFMTLGATKEEGRGSSVTFKLKDKEAMFHRPHPRKEAREFLEEVGITP